jgi:bacteriocin biosynthesis cyclodehydratase domain-containing protein
VLARRQAAYVRVHGTGPVASGLASLLTASGVGQVSCTGTTGGGADHTAAGATTAGGGAGGGAAGGRTAGGGAADPSGTGPRLSSWPPAGRVRLGHPGADPPPRARRGRQPDRRRPDLAVLTGGYQPELPGTLVAGNVAHLSVAASEAIGVVGPLVIPGRTSCLSCVDMARTDRDPAWPLILAQACGRAPHPVACAAVLAAAVAAQATAQVLAFLDRAAPAAAVINGTLELVLPDWQWRRHSWAQHPQCRCSRRPAS